MKEKLYTIPVSDAFRLNTECPLCHLQRKCEEQILDTLMNSAYMEPDCRIHTNALGFCSGHLQKLYDRQNRLGMALMLETHLQDVLSSLEGSCAHPERERKSSLFPFFKNSCGEKLASIVRNRTQSCAICRQVDETMERYVQTVLYLYKSSDVFRTSYAKSKGFCLPHFANLLSIADKQLYGKILDDFLLQSQTIELKALKRVEADLSWFTKKFDYRNQDKPWGTSRTAVERAANKLRGYTCDVNECSDTDGI